MVVHSTVIYFVPIKQGGVYLVNFLNVYGPGMACLECSSFSFTTNHNFSPGLAILFVVFVEAAGVFWFYGVDRFSADIELMLGEKPSL